MEQGQGLSEVLTFKFRPKWQGISHSEDLEEDLPRQKEKQLQSLYDGNKLKRVWGKKEWFTEGKPGNRKTSEEAGGIIQMKTIKNLN